MKIHNIETPGGRAAARTRGHVAARRAGGDIRVRDLSGNDIVVSTLVVDTVVELDDEEGQIGASSGLLLPDSQVVEEKDADNPTFNFAALVENIVKVGSTYYCPYTSATTGDVKIATATDRDGPWTHDSTIFTQASVVWDSGASLYAPEIVENAGTYYLFYSMIVAGGTTSSSNAIGVATATAITGPYTDHGAAILSPSAAGAWDSRRVGEPSVIVHGGQWVMAYMGEDSDDAYQASEKIGIATAPAATGPWTRAAGNPLVGFGSSGQFDDALVADPCLFYANGYYWMMYAGGIDAGPSTRAEQGLAYATDPTGTWTKYHGNPILTVGANGTWDDVWVFRGGLLYEDGEWSGVYTGYDGSSFKGGNFRLTVQSLGDAIPVAGDITIVDAGGYYDSTEVEGALQEIGEALEVIPTTIAASGAVGELVLSDSASTPPVFGDILTNEAETDFLYGDLT